MFLIVFKVKHNITCSKLCFNCLASFLRPSANFLNDHILCLHVVMSQSPYWLLSSGPKFKSMTFLHFNLRTKTHPSNQTLCCLLLLPLNLCLLVSSNQCLTTLLETIIQEMNSDHVFTHHL